MLGWIPCIADGTLDVDIAQYCMQSLRVCSSEHIRSAMFLVQVRMSVDGTMQPVYVLQ